MDETVELTVSMVFADVLVPLPRSVEQGEQASMVYQDNHYWMSPYETRGQITKILLPSSELEVPIEITDAPTSVRVPHTQTHPGKGPPPRISSLHFHSSQPSTRFREGTLTPYPSPALASSALQVMGDIVQYGVYDNVPAYKYSPSTIHFKHSAPIVVATSSTRSVSVSHWGTVAFEESLELVNAGAELKGPFSREDFMKNPKSQGVGAANMLSAMLPADAQ
jgi:oligosaccharyltransferase complex subunit alpha (ribophorin I)